MYQVIGSMNIIKTTRYINKITATFCSYTTTTTFFMLLDSKLLDMICSWFCSYTTLGPKKIQKCRSKSNGNTNIEV